MIFTRGCYDVFLIFTDLQAYADLGKVFET
jgi:hypothetical protein